MPDDLLGQLRQIVDILLGEALARSEHYALTGMDAKRIEILHVADRDAAVRGIADDLELNLLPSLQRLLDEHLRGEGESLGAEFLKFRIVVDETGAEATQRICGTQDQWITQVVGGSPGLFEVRCRVRLDGKDVYLVETLHGQFAVPGIHNGLDRRSEYLYAILLQHSAAVQFHTAVKRGLSPEREEYALRALLGDDFLDEERSHRQEINMVGDTFGSLYGCDIGVDQDRLHTVFTQGLQRLGAGVVKLAGLAYLECSGTEQDDFLD